VQASRPRLSPLLPHIHALDNILHVQASINRPLTPRPLSNLHPQPPKALDIMPIRSRPLAQPAILARLYSPNLNAADRDHCMQYALAVVLLKGGIPAPEDFQNTSPWAGSPAVEALRERIYVREDEQFTRDYLDLEKKSVSSAVSIQLADGRVLEEVVVEYPVGHVKHPRTSEDVRRKFTRNMALMFTTAETERVIKVVEEEDSMRIADFVDLLVRSHERIRKL